MQASTRIRFRFVSVCPLHFCLRHRNSPSKTLKKTSQKTLNFPPKCTKSQPKSLAAPPAAAATAESRDQKLNRIADELIALTKAEREDYSILFRHNLGLTQWVSSSNLAAVASSSAAGPAAADTAVEEKKEEKTSFDIKLEKFEAAAKIKVIKEVRAFTDLGLKEAKELVEKAPVVEIGAAAALE